MPPATRVYAYVFFAYVSSPALCAARLICLCRSVLCGAFARDTCHMLSFTRGLRDGAGAACWLDIMILRRRYLCCLLPYAVLLLRVLPSRRCHGFIDAAGFMPPLYATKETS